VKSEWKVKRINEDSRERSDRWIRRAKRQKWKCRERRNIEGKREQK